MKINYERMLKYTYTRVFPLKFIFSIEYFNKGFKNIFRTDDDDWKFSCLIMLRNLSNEQLLNFKDELNLLATEPTPGEIASGTDTEANELLKRII